MERARVPQERHVARTKPEIAIEEIDRVIAAGVRFGCVLADAGYGSSGPFRQALSERGLQWAVGMSRRQNVYPADTGLVFPEATTGRRRKYYIPDRTAVSAELMLADANWQTISLRRGTKGKLTCKFAACRIRVADGHRHRMRDGRVQATLFEPFRKLDSLVVSRARQDERAQLLMTVPGVGALISLTFVSAKDDPGRVIPELGDRDSGGVAKGGAS